MGFAQLRTEALPLPQRAHRFMGTDDGADKEDQASPSLAEDTMLTKIKIKAGLRQKGQEGRKGNTNEQEKCGNTCLVHFQIDVKTCQSIGMRYFIIKYIGWIFVSFSLSLSLLTF